MSTLVYGVLLAVAYSAILFGGGMGSTSTTTNVDGYTTATTSIGAGGLIVMVVGYLLIYAVGIFAQSAFLSGCLDIADGRPVTIGSFFKPRNLGKVILAAMIVGILTSIGSFLCIIPGLILGIFAQFTIPFVIDRSQGAIDGLKSSFSTVQSNFVNALLVVAGRGGGSRRRLDGLRRRGARRGARRRARPDLRLPQAVRRPGRPAGAAGWVPGGAATRPAAGPPAG